MTSNNQGFLADGQQRLRKAIQEDVRAKYREGLAAATDQAPRPALEAKIRREISEEINRLGSDYSLWQTLNVQMRNSKWPNGVFAG